MWLWLTSQSLTNSNDEHDLQATYDKCFEEYSKLRKLNKNVYKKLIKELEREKATLLAKLDDPLVLTDKLHD